MYVERNKKIRGWIIRILARAYPAGLEGDTIFKQLHDLGYKITRKEFDSNTAYVIEDSFVEEKNLGDFLGYNDRLSNTIYKLTTKGIDLSEGTKSDSGVSL